MLPGLLALAVALNPVPHGVLPPPPAPMAVENIADFAATPLVARGPAFGPVLGDVEIAALTAPPQADAAAPTASPAAAPAPPAAAETSAAAMPPSASGRDPLEGFNRLSYNISQPIDRFIIRPVAIAYTKVVPHPLRDGVHNFLGNLFEPVVLVNDLLQLRFKRAAKTIARTVINTTLGAGGLFDVAKRHYINLPDHPNGFADTLAYYGIGPGPYIYLPVLGPTTLRDAVGSVGDFYTQPRLLGKIINPDNEKSFFHSTPKFGVSSSIVAGLGGIDERARADDALEALRRSSVDPYASLRASYLQNRAGEIAALKAKDGAVPAIPTLDDPLTDPGGPSAGPTPGDAATLPTATSPAPAQTPHP